MSDGTLAMFIGLWGALTLAFVLVALVALDVRRQQRWIDQLNNHVCDLERRLAAPPHQGD